MISLLPRCHGVWLTLVVVTALLLFSPVFADDEAFITADNLTDEHVLAAIDAIVEGLYDRQHPEHFWERGAGRGAGGEHQGGGYTALVALALLHAGESYQSPRLREAIEYLQRIELQGTYAVSVRLSLWANLPPRFEPNLRADAQWLMDGFSEQVGSWTYYQHPDTTRRDNSLRQFGALGLWDAGKRGVRVPSAIWHAIEGELLEMQTLEGGWNYTGSGPATGSMTVAGLATLLITQDLLHTDAYRSLRTTTPTAQQKGLEAAWQWLDEHFSATENPNRSEYFYYYLYGLERVGLAGGRKYFGGEDWYRLGAAELLRRFCRWDVQTRTMHLHSQVGGDGARIRNDDLAFGLMFLSRGRLPVVINKLRDPSIRWNNRPRDAANLAIWIAGETARHVLWQVTDINAPSEQWLDAPLQYFSSNEAISWAEDEDDERWRNLKEYLDLGGLLFAVNEGSTRAFANSIEATGRAMYPDYEWRTLSPEHWAYDIHQPVNRHRPRLRALSNGVRDLIILAVEGDLSATLHTRNLRNTTHYHTASNVYFYASELDRPRPRLSVLRSNAPRSDEHWPRATAISGTIVQAQYEGNWNPEPRALEAFVRWMNARDEVEVTLKTHPLAEIDTIEPKPMLVQVRGVHSKQWTEREQHAIERYLENRGIILFETVGGMGDFAEKAEFTVQQMLGTEARPASRSRIVTGDGLRYGLDLSRIDYRPYTMNALGSLETTSRLRGITIDGEFRAMFSRDDLSHAMLDQPCWGINGYSTDSARRLYRNIVLYAEAHANSDG